MKLEITILGIIFAHKVTSAYACYLDNVDYQVKNIKYHVLRLRRNTLW